MYKILCDNNTICDSRVEELALIDPIVKLEENKAGSFTFNMAKNHPFYDSIQKRTSVIEVWDDDLLLFCGSCTEIEKDFYNTKYFYCEGELAYLNDSIQRPARYQNATVMGYLEALIANHNAQVDSFKQFTVGVVTVTDPNDSIYRYTNMESTMACLKDDLVDSLGGIIRIRHENGIRYIDYLADYANTNSQVIKFGKNLLDLTSNMDSADIATAIIPLGATQEAGTEVEGLETRLTIKSVNNNVDYVYSQDAVNAYGWIYKTVVWDAVTTASALKSKGEAYLSDIQFENMVIEAKAVDMHIVEGSVEQFKIGDKIRVLSAPHGLDRYFPLTKQTINLNARDKNSITLGKSERVSLTAKSNSANEAVKKALEDIPNTSDVLLQAQANASAMLKTAMNGYIVMGMNEDGSPKELLIMDTNSIETATKVWRWNVNGLGYSSNGYNGNYGTAITMNGNIVADYITTGTMQADRIKGGTLNLGGSGNGNGVAYVKNANGDVLVTLDVNGITLASDVKISWDNVNAPSDLAKTSDIPSDAHITQITKNTVSTETITAQNLNITGNSTIQMGANNTVNNNYMYLVGQTNGVTHESVINTTSYSAYGDDGYSASLTRAMLSLTKDSSAYFQVYEANGEPLVNTGNSNLNINAPETVMNTAKAIDFEFVGGGSLQKLDSNTVYLDKGLTSSGIISGTEVSGASLFITGNANISGNVTGNGSNMTVDFIDKNGTYRNMTLSEALNIACTQ